MQRWASTVARGRIPQAAAVIIGNEVLSGKTKDTNSYYLARTLFDQGVRFARIETIPDLIDDISSTVRRLSSSFDYVRLHLVCVSPNGMLLIVSVSSRSLQVGASDALMYAFIAAPNSWSLRMYLTLSFLLSG